MGSEDSPQVSNSLQADSIEKTIILLSREGLSVYVRKDRTIHLIGRITAMRKQTNGLSGIAKVTSCRYQIIYLKYRRAIYPEVLVEAVKSINEYK